ncbi:hypothetical protein Pssp01_02280 [Pseudomonas sp. NBRC 100443]|nr:hypothetical protein Pssp01_02280 [Pseudomonas sp. NBRC 100443]
MLGLFPHPSPLPEGEGAVRAGWEWGFSRGRLGFRLTPTSPHTPNGPLSLRERVRVRGPQACPAPPPSIPQGPLSQASLTPALSQRERELSVPAGSGVSAGNAWVSD